MLFSSIPFLFYFLPAVLILYFLAPNKLKNAVLLLFSLVFYAWGEPKYVVLMLASITLGYLFGLAIDRAKQQRWKRVWMTASCVTLLGLLGWFKYADFVVGNVNSLLGTQIPLLKLALPVGISFYTFQILSYTIDVYRGRVESQKNIISFGAYVSLFPQLIAGPIVRYIDVDRELRCRTHSLEGVRTGLGRFLTGLGKKVLIANNLGLFIEIFRESGEQSVIFYWLYAIAFSLHIYFDFSGYSDMAIGLGRVFGFHFIENFNYPFISSSVSEFWRRWHISLGSWFRDYVYIPMGGNRVSKARWVLNILTVWMLTGLWHGAAWNFVAWGLLFAVLLMAEKLLPIGKLPKAARHGYVLLTVLFSFVLFNAVDIGQALSDMAAMLGLRGLPLFSAETGYYLRSYLVLLAVAVVGATPLPKLLWSKLDGTRVQTVAAFVFQLALLLLCTAYLVDGSFNPFLYFRF
jgi:alginate O-acetyltransferase complex protein AlgI